MSEFLDLELINELREIMADDFDALLHTFLVESEKQYTQVRDAWQNQDLDSLRRAAHSLKGSCGNIGAHELHALCNALEQQALAGQTDEIDALLSDAQHQLDQVCEAVRTL